MQDIGASRSESHFRVSESCAGARIDLDLRPTSKLKLKLGHLKVGSLSDWLARANLKCSEFIHPNKKLAEAHSRILLAGRLQTKGISWHPRLIHSDLYQLGAFLTDCKCMLEAPCSIASLPSFQFEGASDGSAGQLQIVSMCWPPLYCLPFNLYICIDIFPSMSLSLSFEPRCLRRKQRLLASNRK